MVFCVNMNMHADGEDSINAYLADTISSVFGQVYTADVTGNTNRELFAGRGTDPAEELERNVGTVENDALRTMLDEVNSGLTAYAEGSRILTDDKAPVEMLGMRAIDALIQDELGYYKNVFKTEGISSLISSF